MVKHVILWTIKSEYSTDEKKKIIDGIKTSLEALNGKIDGLKYLNVYTDPLESSNTEVMLDSCFEDAAALAGYTVHPDHVAAATGFVRPYTDVRSVFDCEA